MECVIHVFHCTTNIDKITFMLGYVGDIATGQGKVIFHKCSMIVNNNSLNWMAKYR